jgi:hypothetical protein
MKKRQKEMHGVEVTDAYKRSSLLNLIERVNTIIVTGLLTLNVNSVQDFRTRASLSFDFFFAPTVVKHTSP